MMASAGTGANWAANLSSPPATPLNGTQGTEMYTSTVNATRTFTLTTPANVTTLNLKYRQVNGGAGAFNVSVDGVAVNEKYSSTASWSKAPAGGVSTFTPYNGINWVAQNIPVASATTHTVVVTNLDGNNLFLVGVDYFLPTPAANTNVVEYLNTNVAAAWPYVALYNATLVNVINDFHALGQTEMILADQNNGVTYAGVTYPGLTSADLGVTATCAAGGIGQHPNCTGYPKIAAIMEYTAALAGYPYAFTGGGDAAAPERFYSAQITTLASAVTIAPVSGVVHVTGTAAIATLTPMTYCPLSGSGARCTVTLVPDGAFTTVATGNIAAASTATVGRAMVMTYDIGAAKWYSSY